MGYNKVNKRMKTKNVFFLILFLVISFMLKAQQDFRVKATYESRQGKYRPVFYIVWPKDFNGNKYDVRVHISYDVKTSDGSWHNYNHATIWGVSGKYELEWVYAYNKPIVDMNIRITSVDGYKQPTNNKSSNNYGNKNYNSTDSYSGGAVPLPSLAISMGYLFSEICYGPYFDISMYMGEEIGGIVYGGYGSRGDSDIYRFGFGGFFCGEENTRNENAILLECAWEMVNNKPDEDDISFLVCYEYTRYFFDNNSLGIFAKIGIGVGGQDLYPNGTAKEDVFLYGLQIGGKMNIVNMFKW